MSLGSHFTIALLRPFALCSEKPRSCAARHRCICSTSSSSQTASRRSRSQCSSAVRSSSMKTPSAQPDVGTTCTPWCDAARDVNAVLSRRCGAPPVASHGRPAQAPAGAAPGPAASRADEAPRRPASAATVLAAGWAANAPRAAAAGASLRRIEAEREARKLAAEAARARPIQIEVSRRAATQRAEPRRRARGERARRARRRSALRGQPCKRRRSGGRSWCWLAGCSVRRGPSGRLPVRAAQLLGAG
jgi:hypothetical protein